ncbi:universal stress protein [Methanolobus mangrovi]|uniref:Universal stress protein n=1 Tax=Methanolobus mangrovi TaxID=3072977 RepID=A0AA51YHJ3_9EURY|nr:universal stress protein [Methanolobus mangrovi]WMW23221.1 universal stress protein [Methanolobus mangrovi]
MSAEIKTIAIATDGSENVMNAVEWGIGLAKANGAKVSALYVVPHTGVTLAMRGEMWSKALENHLKDEGEKATAYVVEAGKKAGLIVEPVIIDGKTPADGIVDFAKENDTNLIVMGTLGVTGLSHILLGSVAENVVRHAKRPVLVIP